jgi:hypothetical protein
MATTTGSSPSKGVKESVPPRISRALTTVIKLMAMFRATARRAV